MTDLTAEDRMLIAVKTALVRERSARLPHEEITELLGDMLVEEGAAKIREAERAAIERCARLVEQAPGNCWSTEDTAAQIRALFQEPGHE